jgi:hypothetical protein
MEQNAYVTNAITEKEMGGGIVIGHVSKKEIHNDEFLTAVRFSLSLSLSLSVWHCQAVCE